MAATSDNHDRSVRGRVFVPDVRGWVLTEKGRSMLRVLFVALVILLVTTFPATWLLMLFLGNVGLDLSYWGTLPLGILVSSLVSGSGAGSMRL